MTKNKDIIAWQAIIDSIISVYLLYTYAIRKYTSKIFLHCLKKIKKLKLETIKISCNNRISYYKQI